MSFYPSPVQRHVQCNDLALDRRYSLAIFQANDPTTFDTEVEQWLESLPHDSFAAIGVLPSPGQVLVRPGYGRNAVRIQRDTFLAISGTLASNIDTVRFSICAPPHLFLSAHPPMLSTWVPISYWGLVATWTVINALQYAASSLLAPYDRGETVSGQIFVKTLVGLTLSSATCAHVNDR